MSDLYKIKQFNRDQIEHIQLVQKLCWDFCDEIMREVIKHDNSKWSPAEYDAFVEARDSLRGSSDGKDEEYQKHLKSDAIQHHITNNRHHPEYWDAIGELMPVSEVIMMYFDWKSRCMAKGNSMEGFWDYNLKKLEKQPHAIAIVTALRRDFND